MMRVTPMVKNILIINVVIALIQMLGINLNEYLGLRVVFSDDWAPWQFFTYMWLHAGFRHLLGNMFAVFMFGPMLENVWGSKRFLQFYLICGIGAGVLYGAADFVEKYPLKQDMEAYIDNPTPDGFRYYIMDHQVSDDATMMLRDLSDQYYENPDDQAIINETKTYAQQIYDVNINGLMVGASGAVFAILMAFGMLFPNTQLMLLIPPIPIKAKYFVLGYGALELYLEMNRSVGDNVAHLAHLGGMLFAFILLKFWSKKSNRFY